MKTEPKQVIVIRKDLNMRKGKMVAQGAHASMAAVLSVCQVVHNESDLDGSITDIVLEGTLKAKREVFNGQPDIDHTPLIEWLEGRFTKICVSVNSEEELLSVYQKAKEAGILCSLITDAGLTEFNGVPTKTCCAIGPDYPDNIDPITKDLKLL